MKIIDGDFKGCKGQILNDVFKGPIIIIRISLMNSKS